MDIKAKKNNLCQVYHPGSLDITPPLWRYHRPSKQCNTKRHPGSTQKKTTGARWHRTLWKTWKRGREPFGTGGPSSGTRTLLSVAPAPRAEPTRPPDAPQAPSGATIVCFSPVLKRRKPCVTRQPQQHIYAACLPPPPLARRIKWHIYVDNTMVQ